MGCFFFFFLFFFFFFPCIRRQFEPSHEIMALFVLCNLILQTRMRSHPVGLDIWFFVWPSVYFHTSCVRTAKALVRLCGCAGSPEPSLVAYVISTIISWAGSFTLFQVIPHPVQQSSDTTQDCMVIERILNTRCIFFFFLAFGDPPPLFFFF